jgi:hypothetical protein
MGYGFDLDEWVDDAEIRAWRDYMHRHLGWPHLLGGRPAGPNHGPDHTRYRRWNEPLDYASYEHHRPTYEVYAAALDQTPTKPVFSEDRFRIRRGGYPEKDYDTERTRRGLWHSAMAGGVANIWGHLHNSPDGGATSGPYPQPAWIKTNARFFRDRFLKDLVREIAITDGRCLRDAAEAHYLFYAEDASSIRMKLSAMKGAQPAVAVDAKKVYAEQRLGRLLPKDQTWTAPYRSDWAVAVGDYATGAAR